VSTTIRRYGLDGVDLDDEGVEYGANGTGQPNEFSFVAFVQSLRKRLPNRLLTFYVIGPSAANQEHGGTRAGALLDHARNPAPRPARRRRGRARAGERRGPRSRARLRGTHRRGLLRRVPDVSAGGGGSVRAGLRLHRAALRQPGPRRLAWGGPARGRATAAA